MGIKVEGCVFKECPDYYRGFESGNKSQQAKIDELQKRIDEAILALEQSKPLAMRQADAKQALDILRGENENQD